jgi:hypothetical protein
METLSGATRSKTCCYRAGRGGSGSQVDLRWIRAARAAMTRFAAKPQTSLRQGVITNDRRASRHQARTRPLASTRRAGRRPRSGSMSPGHSLWRARINKTSKEGVPNIAAPLKKRTIGLPAGSLCFVDPMPGFASITRFSAQLTPRRPRRATLGRNWVQKSLRRPWLSRPTATSPRTKN